jgi:hypothetical protein
VTPEQEERVRRALAEAAAADRPEDGTDAPVPADVADRLDTVLAGLVAERAAGRPLPTRESGSGHSPPGDELAARRARRWPQVLVAAAVVAVLALTGGVVALRGLGGGQADSTAAGASSAEDAGGGSADKAAPESAGSPGGSGSEAFVAVPPPELSSGTLRRDVQRVVAGGVAGQLRGDVPSAGAADQPSDQPTDQSSAASGDAGGGRAGARCQSPRAPRDADLVDVLLDGEPAVLVLRPGSGGAIEAQVYACDEPHRPLRETTVRAP